MTLCSGIREKNKELTWNGFFWFGLFPASRRVASCHFAFPGDGERHLENEVPLVEVLRLSIVFALVMSLDVVAWRTAARSLAVYGVGFHILAAGPGS